MSVNPFLVLSEAQRICEFRIWESASTRSKADYETRPPPLPLASVKYVMLKAHALHTDQPSPVLNYDSPNQI